MRDATAYTPEYIEQCFTVWYAEGRPDTISVEVLEKFPKDPYGRVPTYDSVRRWIRKYRWIEHANDLDSKALELRDTTLIQRKAQLLQKQAEDSFLLAKKAHTHLISGTFDSSAAAVQAYFRATEEIRKVIGLSELLQRLGEMSDEEVQDEIKKRLTRAAEAGQIIVEGEELIGGDNDDETP